MWGCRATRRRRGLHTEFQAESNKSNTISVDSMPRETRHLDLGGAASHQHQVKQVAQCRVELMRVAKSFKVVNKTTSSSLKAEPEHISKTSKYTLTVQV